MNGKVMMCYFLGLRTTTTDIVHNFSEEDGQSPTISQFLGIIAVSHLLSPLDDTLDDSSRRKGLFWVVLS